MYVCMPVESEPTCKALLVPTVGTNGIAGQSVASSHDSRECLGSGGTCRASGRVFRGSSG